MKIKCQNCKQVYLETTDKYDASVLPDGSMVRLLEKYEKLHWSAFADGLKACKGTAYSSMRCPSCTASMLVKNRLVVIPDPEPETKTVPEFKCEICGKAFKARIALVGHSRSHKKD